MKISIKSFSVNKFALTFALVSSVGSLLFLIPFFFMISIVNNVNSPGQNIPIVAPFLMIVLMPVFYFIFGYIMGVIGAFTYNLIAKLTGGIEMTLGGQIEVLEESGNSDNY